MKRLRRGYSQVIMQFFADEELPSAEGDSYLDRIRAIKEIYHNIPADEEWRYKQSSPQTDETASMAESLFQSEMNESKILNRAMILNHSAMTKPEEVLEIMLNGCNISDIQEEDLKLFPSITYVDLGENNQLILSKLQHLVQLREIYLYCNSLTKIYVPEHCFEQVLDLSYNNFSTHADLFKEIGKMKKLKKLLLNHCEISTLPQLFSFPQLMHFELESNHLFETTIFESLNSIPHLQYVNLNKNKITKVSKLNTDVLSHLTLTQPLYAIQSLQVIKLAENSIAYFEDVYSLLDFPKLTLLELYENPVVMKRRDLEIVKSEFTSQNITVIDKNPHGEYRPYQKSKKSKLKITDVLNKQTLKPFYYVELMENSSIVPSEVGSATPMNEYEDSEEDSGSSFFITEFEDKETKSVDEIPITANSLTKQKPVSRTIKSATDSRVVATKNTQPIITQKTTPEKRYMATPDALVHYDYNADWFQLENTINMIEKDLLEDTEICGTSATGSRLGTTSTKLDKQSPYTQLKNTLEKPLLSVTSSKFIPKERLSTKMKKREEEAQKNIQNLYKVTH